jgi:GTP-binding protein
MEQDGQQEVIAQGGRGGRGNARFTSSVRRAPRMAEKGEPATNLKLRLELKLLADVGLVGLPNAGKSTFLRAVSNARPKVADYPFTTLFPSLGIVKPEGQNSFCMADIPGLIEGAHSGTGLGIHFLKHIERTRLLLHLVDTSALDLEDVASNYYVIMNELKAFSEELAVRPVIVAANKMDLPDSRELFEDFKNSLEMKGIRVFPVSGATGQGVEELIKFIGRELKRLQKPVIVQPNEDEALYQYLAPFMIEQQQQGYWLVTGSEIEKIVAMTDFTNDEAILAFKRKLKKMGFLDEILNLDAAEDDVFAIGEMEFELQEFFD